MEVNEDYMVYNNREDELKARINDIREEIRELSNMPIPTITRGMVDNNKMDSDLGVNMNYGKKMGERYLSPEEQKHIMERREMRIIDLKNELALLNNELLSIERKKPEYIAKRDEMLQQQRDQRVNELLDQRKDKHEEKYSNLKKLAQYLEIAGMSRLAEQVLKFRYVKNDGNKQYLDDEVAIRINDLAQRKKTRTTFREQLEIKNSIKKLSKEATQMAKKHKELQKLCDNARRIVRDIENKKISYKSGVSLANALEEYFTQPTGRYYSALSSKNLGYELLGFYRDKNSKYNEDLKNHKI